MSRRRLTLLAALLASAAVACSNPVAPDPVAQDCPVIVGGSTC